MSYRYCIIGNAIWRWQRLTSAAGIWTPLKRPPSGLPKIIAQHPGRREFEFCPRTRVGHPVPSWQEISA